MAAKPQPRGKERARTATGVRATGGIGKRRRICFTESMKLFSSLFRSRSAPPPAPSGPEAAAAPQKPPVEMPPLAPEAPLAVIGDIHGRRDLLEALLARLDREAPELRIICVGDYVDRGEDSAGVLRLLCARPEITCLSGNHEEMLLGFLDEPEARGPRWLRHGGLQTLASYGIPAPGDRPRPEALRALSAAFRAALDPGVESWLRALPVLHRSGNVAVVHAAAAPTLPIGLQSRQTLLWGHPDFTEIAREDGLWVVHGHTILPEPRVEAGRIGVDTGAYASGRLTAAVIRNGELSFLTA